METIYITCENGVVTGVYTTTPRHDVDVQVINLDTTPSAVVPESAYQLY